MTLATAVQLPANALIAFSYFVGKGLSPNASAGIVGNLIQESGVDPNEPNGGGIAQWTDPGRNQKLHDYAAASGQPVNSLAAQLGFVWYELNTSYAGTLAALKTANSPAAAAIVFQNDYELCLGSNTSNPNVAGGCNQNARVNNANNVFRAGTGQAPSITSQAASLLSSTNSNPSSFQNTCQVGFTTPSVIGIGGAQVCLWQYSWTRALGGGLLIVAGGVLAMAGLGLLVGGEAIKSINKNPVSRIVSRRAGVPLG